MIGAPKGETVHQRQIAKSIAQRLGEPRAFMQIIMGPRQTGKTTAARQAVTASGLEGRYASADGIAVPPAAWLESEWHQARLLTRGGAAAVLVLDEIQKVTGWSEVVKRLWDEDSWNEIPLHVILSGSSALLLQQGLSESLAGRYEVLRSTHWSYAEMRDAFGYSLDDYLLFGGYPGAARLVGDEERWADYMRDSIVEATLSRDVLQMEAVRKPALLRGLFLLGAQYSGQEMSYRKVLGQLGDGGNTATVAHYLELLDNAGLLSGLKKYDVKPLRTNASSPRFMVHDSSLVAATWQGARDELLGDSAVRGHLVESAVGAYLLACSHIGRFDVRWWREAGAEVDFVLSKGSALIAIEVKSGRVKSTGGLVEFISRYPQATPILVGDANVSVESFLAGEVPLFE